MKKITSRGVNRVSSTNKGRRPKQKVGDSALETAAPMKSEVNATAPATGGAPVSGRVSLGTSCTIHEVQALRAHMMAQSAHTGPFEIDGGNVQQVDTAGVQLVVAFALDCLERGVHYTGGHAQLG